MTSTARCEAQVGMEGSEGVERLWPARKCLSRWLLDAHSTSSADQFRVILAVVRIMTSKSSPYVGDEEEKEEEEAVCDVASASISVKSISSELDRQRACYSEETGDRASRFGSIVTELATEDWDRERPTTSLSARFNCEPHECRHRSASAAGGPAPQGADAWLPSSVNRAKQERYCFTVKRSQWSQPAPSRADCACCAPRHTTQSSWEFLGVMYLSHGHS